MPQTLTAPSFTDLLRSAVTEPGTIHAAYSAFHNYSLGNQLLAMFQCHARGIAPGPIATFPRWKELRRYVRKGEKAIELCMPITCKRSEPETADDDAATFTRFIYRRNWFVLSQTDGEPYMPPALPGWDTARALAALDVTETPFELLNGNVQGYAQPARRTIAISPVAAHPFKTTIHEIAHVLMHGEATDLSDGADTPRDMREVEAESVAMLVSAALGQPGLDDSRGYIQHWYQGNEIPEANARRILKTADQILRAGRDSEASHE